MLGGADFAVVPAIADPDKFPEEDRLDPEQLVTDVVSSGGDAVYLASVEAIAEHIARHARAPDVVAVLSNGGFGGLHQLILSSLASSGQEG